MLLTECCQEQRETAPLYDATVFSSQLRRRRQEIAVAVMEFQFEIYGCGGAVVEPLVQRAQEGEQLCPSNPFQTVITPSPRF